jgi:hypothetical protein
MAIVNFSGVESGSIEAGSTVGEFLTASGSVALETTIVHSGSYSVRCNPTGTALGYMGFGTISTAGVHNNSSDVNTAYVQFWFRYATKPASGREPIFGAFDVANTSKAHVCLDSNGLLSFLDKNGTLVATGSTVLAANTWYRIEVKVSTGTGNQPYEVRINGVSELSGDANQGTNANGSWRFGKSGDLNGQTVDLYYDDMIVDNAAYPGGDVSIKVITPNANGSTMSWSAGTNSSDYQEVDEVPFNDADYVQSPTSGNPNIGLFQMTDTGSVGINGTILSLKGYIRTRENTSVTSAVKLRIKSGSSTQDTSTRNGTTTVAVQQLIANTDPATSAAWTQGGIDSVEIGAVEDNAVATRLTSVMGHVAYIPSAITPPRLLPLLGVG